MADKTAFDYVNEIWSIANYVRDVIRPADYNKLILPFAVLRRFECALEPTRAAVSRQAAKGVWDDDDPKYCALSGHCFYEVLRPLRPLLLQRHELHALQPRGDEDL